LAAASQFLGFKPTVADRNTQKREFNVPGEVKEVRVSQPIGMIRSGFFCGVRLTVKWPTIKFCGFVGSQKAPISFSMKKPVLFEFISAQKMVEKISRFGNAVTCPIKKFCNARLKTKIVRSCLFKDPR
jgi:hypothetical protein